MGIMDQIPYNAGNQGLVDKSELDRFLTEKVWGFPNKGSQEKWIPISKNLFDEIVEVQRVWKLIHQNRFNPFSKYFYIGLYRYTIGALLWRIEKFREQR